MAPELKVFVLENYSALRRGKKVSQLYKTVPDAKEGIDAAESLCRTCPLFSACNPYINFRGKRVIVSGAETNNKNCILPG